MAASDVDIVNKALAHLGDIANVASIDPSDGSVQADHAARIYGDTRDWLLERFPWKFALTRETLAQRSDITYGSWLYVYEEPNNCLRVLAILPTGYTSDAGTEVFETEADSEGAPLILANATSATARFIRRVTDPARFSPGFTETLSWLLAAQLAGPLIKGETGRQEQIRCLQAAAMNYGLATTMSATQSHRDLEFVPSFIAARGALMTVDDDATPIIRS